MAALTAVDKVQVYYDANCPICTASKERLQSLDSASALEFIDINSPEAEAAAAGRFSRSDLARQMYVHLPDGTWRAGYFALAEIFKHIPGRAWLATIMLQFPIAEIGHRAYRALAKRRYAISKICTSGACSLHKE